MVGPPARSTQPHLAVTAVVPRMVPRMVCGRRNFQNAFGKLASFCARLLSSLPLGNDAADAVDEGSGSSRRPTTGAYTGFIKLIRLTNLLMTSALLLRISAGLPTGGWKGATRRPAVRRTGSCAGRDVEANELLSRLQLVQASISRPIGGLVRVRLPKVQLTTRIYTDLNAL